MKSETKIFLDKEDTVETVIGHLEMSPADAVVINVPKNSVLTQSAGNFRILKKISEKTGKEISIESVDDHAVEFAEAAKIPATNPVFRAREKISVNDVTPESQFSGAVRFVNTRGAYNNSNNDHDYDNENEKSGLSANRFVWFSGGFIILMLVGFGAFQLTTRILPKATVTFTLKKISVPFEEIIEISTKAADIDIESGDIVLVSGELFTAKKNVEMQFTASGKKKTTTKATGVITIFNAFNAQSQTLVKSTRFETPDGKIFRLDDQVIVPGAQVSGGKIIPSSVDVTVTADQSGMEYNVPPILLWRIPGFKGTPRYEGFYGKSSHAMSGGFTGEVASYTDEDLTEAKTTVLASLKDAVEGYMRITLKTNLKLLDGASIFEVLKEEPHLSPNDLAHFSIFAEGQMKNLVFDEKTVRDVLVSKLKKTVDPDTRVKEFTITYEKPNNVNLSAGKMSFSAKGTVIFEADINTADLASKISGANEREFRELIFALPGLEKASISLWPFWVRRVPENAEKVEIITL